MSIQKSTDILIIGGGIIGATIARSLSKFSKNIILLEKESQLGQHASTRNSSVLHSGIYYSTDSLKADFCKRGNEMMTAYIQENKLPLKNTGKFLVATNDDEYQRLIQVKEQSNRNQVDIDWIPIEKAKIQEPSLNIFNKNYHVLYAPSTKVGSNVAVIDQLSKDLSQCSNVKLLTNTRFVQQNKDGVSICEQKKASQTTQYNISSQFVINCGGLYADKIANQFGFCQNHTILPLKGQYLQSNQSVKGLKSLVYPVPPIKGATVLGVHLTHTMDNHIKLGPNAIPALWREQYENNFRNFSFAEFLEIIMIYYNNFLHSTMGAFYRKHALSEIQKMKKSYQISQASKLTSIFDQHNINLPTHFHRNIVPGIRAQLINKQTRQLENDFLIESDFKRSMHVLNVVSPGWTCSFPIAEHITQQLKSNNII